MATRAERFRYEQERSGPKRPPKPKAPRRDEGVDTARAGVSATDRKATKHESLHAGKKAVFALEDSAGRPSRKSTRKSSNRQKTDTQTRLKRNVAEVRPGSRGRQR
jgi:hypothetical protein